LPSITKWTPGARVLEILLNALSASRALATLGRESELQVGKGKQLEAQGHDELALTALDQTVADCGEEITLAALGDVVRVKRDCQRVGNHSDDGRQAATGRREPSQIWRFA